LADDEAVDDRGGRSDGRAGRASRSVPSLYLDTWERLQNQKPFGLSEEKYETALSDFGSFSDRWGAAAVDLGWSAGDIFDVPEDGQEGRIDAGGLVWWLLGRTVLSMDRDNLRLSDGTVLRRSGCDGTLF